MIKKGSVTKNVEVECYEFLAGLLNDNLSLDELTRQYAEVLNLETRGYQSSIHSLGNAQKNIIKGMEMIAEAEINMKINIGLMQIMQKYSDEKLEECAILIERKNKVLKKLNSKQAPSALIERLDEINECIRKDELGKARELIVQLENDVERE